MNDVPRPGNDGARSAQRVPAGSRGPEQAYPDPPRSWTRAGILIGTWVAAWAGVLVFGLGLQAMAQGQDNDRLPFDGQAATQEFFRFTIQERKHDKADSLLCEDFVGATSTEVVATFDTAVDDLNRGNWFDVRVYASEPQTQPESFRITISYGSSQAPSVLRYLSTTSPQDGDDCIVTLEYRDQENDPEKDPEKDPGESPDPGQDGSQTVSNFLAAIFRDQNEGIARSFMCSDYRGTSLEDLLQIRAEHVHEGAGNTLYRLETQARAYEGSRQTTDAFYAAVALDNETHEFMVDFDWGAQQQCIASVTDF